MRANLTTKWLRRVPVRLWLVRFFGFPISFSPFVKLLLEVLASNSINFFRFTNLTPILRYFTPFIKVLYKNILTNALISAIIYMLNLKGNHNA
jgi:hypothetical protein